MIAAIVQTSEITASLVYSLIGIGIFCLTFAIIDWLTPYALWKEIVEEKNIALGVVVAGLCLGICLIIAAAIH